MREELPVDELEELANEEIGEAFRLTRVYYGRSLGDVERALRIRASQIDAIERGAMDELPGRVYAIGFVRSYAEYLGLDGAKAVKLFKEQYMDGADKSALSFYVPVSDVKVPTIWLTTFALIVASFLSLGWYHYNKQDRTLIMQVEEVPDDIAHHVSNDILKTQSLSGGRHDPIEAVAEDSAPVEDMGAEGSEIRTGVILSILDSSWVEIKDGDGNVLVSNILEKGDEYFVPDNPGLSMSLGNAANVEIIVDGKTLKPLGGDGDVRRDIPLDTAYLKTLEFKEEDSLNKTEPSASQ